MAKISRLPLAHVADGTETVPFVQGGVAKRLSLNGFVASVTPFLQDWYKGDKGDPGGTPMAIGLFTIAATLLIPGGTDLVQTSGYQVRGVGHARYAYDPAVSAAYVAANPRAAFVDKNGRGFRLSEDMLDVRMFGAIGGLENEHDAVQAAVATAKATPGRWLSFGGLSLRTGEIDFTNAVGTTFYSAGAKIKPIETLQTGGRFTSTSFSDVAFVGLNFEHIARYNYMGAIDGQNGTRLTVTDCRFTGCGGAIRIQSVKGGVIDRNVYREVGLMPRPDVPGKFGPGGDSFGAAFEHYGFGVRAVLCDDFYVGPGNDFVNSLPAGGATSDITGGAGGFSFYLGDRNVIDGCRAINAPGQGACHAGGWQGTDVVSAMLAGTFDYTRKGQYNAIRNFYGEGCNQEAQTLFGSLRSHIVGGKARNNRFAAGELWECVECTMDIVSAFEDVAARHPIAMGNYGDVAGQAALHCLHSYKCRTTFKVELSRYAIVALGGSYGCEASGQGYNYGAANLSAGMGAGIACGVGIYNRAASEIQLSCTLSASPDNTTRQDIYADLATQIIYSSACRSPGRKVSFGGSAAAFRGAPYQHFSEGLSIGGLSPTLPELKTVSGNGRIEVSGAAYTAILPIAGATASDTFSLVVNGTDVGDGGRTFSDEIRVTPSLVKIRDKWDHAAGIGDRTYVVNNGFLQLKMADGTGTYSVRISGFATLGGSNYV